MKGLVFSFIMFLVLVSTRGHWHGHGHGHGHGHDHEAFLQKEKVTYLHFYFHERVSGEDPTAMLVARPNRTIGDNKLLSFGSTFVYDDPLKEGADPTSKVIGNVQGLAVMSGKDRGTAVLTLDFGFTTGEFNGSSLSFFSRNTVSENPREVAVVGGRGKFRYAQGYAMIRTQVFNPSTENGIYEVNVTVLHYEM